MISYHEDTPVTLLFVLQQEPVRSLQVRHVVWVEVMRFNLVARQIRDTMQEEPLDGLEPTLKQRVICMSRGTLGWTFLGCASLGGRADVFDGSFRALVVLRGCRVCILFLEWSLWHFAHIL